MVLFFLFLAAIAIAGIICIIVYVSRYQPNTAPQQQIINHRQEDDEPDYIFNPSPKTFVITQALLFIGKADGQLREAECQVIADFICAVQPEHRNTPIEHMVQKIREIKPMSAGEYRSFSNKLSITDITRYSEWVYRIIDTQKNLHPFEEYLLEDIKQRIHNFQTSTTPTDGHGIEP